MNSLLSALIVDDEPDVRQGLRALLGAHPELQVIGEAGSVTDALVCMQREKPDVVFLDLEMPGGSGLELASAMEKTSLTVFVTAYPDYALEAFHLGAVDYLLKPVDPDRLAITVERLLERVPSIVSPQSLTVNCAGISGQIEKIRISEILWIDAYQNYTRIHLAQAEKPSLCRHTMAAWEALLPAHLYVRVGRSEIIQLARIQAVRWTSRDVTVVSFDGSDSLLQLGRTSALRLKSLVRDAAGKNE
ncbi:MAG: LytR/AlgR family response regulator transcription factor [Luteolibacter sp.]